MSLLGRDDRLQGGIAYRGNAYCDLSTSTSILNQVTAERKCFLPDICRICWNDVIASLEPSSALRSKDELREVAEVDPKDVQAFNELQSRLIDVTEKQKFVSHTQLLQKVCY